ncbi:MAG: aldose 1-epimerase family protein [Sedimentisphaerales bacterium]|nr:aldose 1-epimerase family protein [Sedimentisphaerales bacterium]
MLSLCFFLMAALLVCALAAVPASRQVLTDVRYNLWAPELLWTRDQIAPDCPHAWSIRKSVLHGGCQEGIDLIELDNGTMRFRIVPTRGMSIQDVKTADIRLGWDAPLTGLVHPKFVNLAGRDGLGWLYGFSEWMVRCGLESFGAPGPDEFVDDQGAKHTMNLTLHGRIGNQPASIVEIQAQTAPPYRLAVRGRVEEAFLHGPKLEIETELVTEAGSSTFSVRDTVTNRGGSSQEFALLYHNNFGPPLLEESARFLGPVKRITPISEHAAADLARYDIYRGPTPGWAEQVYCLEMWPDRENRTMVLLQNAAGDRGASLGYNVEQLPYFTLWKNPAARPDGYVTGLEPATGFPRNRRQERASGRVPILQARQSRSFQLDFAILPGAEAVQAARANIEAIRHGRETTVVKEPLS